MIQFIDTHTHLDGTEFDADRDEVMEAHPINQGD